MMPPFTIEYLDLFGAWRAEESTFDDLTAALNYCITMSDQLQMTYRILDRTNQVIQVVSLEADFWALGDGDS